jgi:hypothetical protein
MLKLPIKRYLTATLVMKGEKFQLNPLGSVRLHNHGWLANTGLNCRKMGE